MTADNFARALALVLVHEGGDSDDPHDPGGRTKWGITHFDYDAYRQRKGLPLRDVFDMDMSECEEIYRTQYWDAISLDKMPSGLDYVLFDGGVNSGISQSVKWLQRALPITPVNGRLSDAVFASVAQVTDMATLIKALCQARRDFLENLSTFQYFGRGWISRVNDVEATALAWAAGTPGPQPEPTAATSQPKALRESAAPLPSTAPGDALSAATAAGIAATVGAHIQAAPTSAAPPATATTPAAPSPAAPTPSSAPPAAPTAPVAPAPVAPTQVALPQPNNTPAPPQAPTAANPPSAGAPAAPAAKSAPSTNAQAPATNAVAAKPAVPPPAQVTAAPPAKPVVTLPPISKQAAPVTQPAHTAVTTAPTWTISQYVYPISLAVLGVLLILGLYLSFASRAARTRRLDALGDNPQPKTSLKIGSAATSAPVAVPKPLPAAKTAPIPASRAAAAPAAAAATIVEDAVPLVQNLYARTASIAWIAFTIVINVIALAKLLQMIGFAHESWHQPFYWLGTLYDSEAGQAFRTMSAYLSQNIGMALPAWLMSVFVLYLSMASAFVVASTGLMKRQTSGEALFAAMIHAGWVFAVPAFVIDAVRYHVVARFARQNTVLFFGYIAAFLAGYILARFINNDFLSAFAQH